MDLNRLIKRTANIRDEILEAHQILFDYQKSNPWYITSMIEELKSQDQTRNIPSFDNLIKLKEDFVVDSYFKIYRQLERKDPLFNSSEQTIFYYSIIKGLYQSQLQDGFEKGDLDDLKRLVTGSDLVLNQIVINVPRFLNIYYSLCN
jgi:hypothetical protein